MKKTKVFVSLLLMFTMAMPLVAYAGKVVTLNGNKNYVRQYMNNWCWAATALNTFVGIDGEVPSNQSDKEYLYDLVKELADREGLRLNNSSNRFDKYDVSAGLWATEEIINQLLEENRYYKYYYEYSNKARSFNSLMSDLSVGFPIAVRLSKTAATNGSIDHIVLINGADSIWDYEKDYDVRILEPESGSNIWVPYVDLVNGTSGKMNFRKYDGTCEYYTY